jgi:hypothetical protein
MGTKAEIPQQSLYEKHELLEKVAVSGFFLRSGLKGPDAQKDAGSNGEVAVWEICTGTG